MKTCKALRCRGTPRTKDLCARHYQQFRRHGRLTPEAEYQTRGWVCYIRHCTDPVLAKGLCNKHYKRKRNG